MSNLEHAITIATAVHADQYDKAGASYISHPLRVMSKFTSEDEQIVAVLHDVIEDSNWTLDGLRQEGFAEEIVAAINSLTRQDYENYDDFIHRAAANPIGRKVKLADLLDNCDLSRISIPTERDYARLKKYRRAIELIEWLSHSSCATMPDLMRHTH